MSSSWSPRPAASLPRRHLRAGSFGSVILLLRVILRPLGYLMFVVALAALSASAKLLGDRDELGFFSDKLSSLLWRYREISRPGIQIAWLVWAVLFLVAASPLDPISSQWDEVALGALGLVALGRHFFAGHRAGH